MPTYFARKAGNINAADVWATTPSGTAAAVTFASGDVLVANSFAITVNVTTNLGSAGQVRNDTTGGATTGGSFTLSNGVTLTANVYAGTASCVFLAANATASIVGNLIAGGVNGRAVQLGVVGTLNVTATNITAAATNAIYIDAFACNLNVTASGLISGGTSLNTAAIRNDGSGTYSITGNCIGGTAAGAHAVHHNTGASLTITGNVTGGGNPTAYGLNNVFNATINITGQCLGGNYAAGVFNTTTGPITATRVVGNGFGPGSVGLAAAPGIANSGLGVVTIEQLEYGTLGQSPTTGTGFRLKKVGTNTATFNFCDTAGAKTLIDATANAAMPAATDVRSGLSYAGGAVTGALAVPLPSQVAVGVATDNTVGTAFVTGSDIATAVWGAATRSITGGTVDTLTNAPASVTPSDIWSHASRTITGGTVDTLTNAPSVPSASAIASQVRTELSVELGRVDAAISTRSTPANIPSANIAAIKSKTDLLNTDRLANVATTNIVGTLLAQSQS